MKKSIFGLVYSFLILLSFSGCVVNREKTASLVGVYIATVVISFILLIGYSIVIKERNLWLLLLFSSVFIINIGYLWLSVSDTLENALMANRVSYLGSVFLPMAMLMITAKASKLKYNKALPYLLLVVGVLVFLIAASPGILDLYYKEVSLEFVNGVSVLNKVYGPWHLTYYIYLFAYFASMVAIIIYTSIKRLVSSSAHAIIVAFAVLVNIGVWLLEQFVDFGFEMLSISYIISELFLLGLSLLLQEEAKKNASVYGNEDVAIDSLNKDSGSVVDGLTELNVNTEEIKMFKNGILNLTATEKMIFDLYLEGNGTKDVLVKMNIKENTLKYHNKNIYSKLGVSSRKHLLEIASDLSLK